MKSRTAFQITRSVLFALILREARGRFGDTRLGAVWLLIEPLCHLFIFTVLFSLIRGGTVASVEYPVFVLVGMAPFLLYRNTALQLMESPRINRPLFAYKQIKPLDTFLARMLVEACISAIVYLLLVAGFAWYGYDMSITAPLEWLAILLLGLLFAFALGILFSLIVHAVPGVRLVIRMLFFPLYFISGVLHPAAYLPPALMPLLLLNPFLHLTELLRASVFTYYEPVTGTSVFYVAAVTLVLLFVSLGLYRARRLHLVSSKNG